MDQWMMRESVMHVCMMYCTKAEGREESRVFLVKDYFIWFFFIEPPLIIIFTIRFRVCLGLFALQGLH